MDLRNPLTKHRADALYAPIGGVSEGVRGRGIELTSADVGVRLIDTAPARSEVTKVLVDVIEEFDGVHPRLEVGDAGDDERHMGEYESKLTRVGVYEATVSHVYAAETDVNATLRIGGAPTRGRCIAYVEYATAP